MPSKRAWKTGGARQGKPIAVEVETLLSSAAEMLEAVETRGGIVLGIVYAKPGGDESKWKLATVTHGEMNESIARSCGEMFNSIADSLGRK